MQHSEFYYAQKFWALPWHRGFQEIQDLSHCKNPMAACLSYQWPASASPADYQSVSWL